MPPSLYETLVRLEEKVDRIIDRLDGDDKFDVFWEKYPKRHGKRGNRRVTKQLWDKLNRQRRDEVFLALSKYSSYLNSCDQFPMDAERFVRGEWQTYIEVEVQVVVPEQKGKWLS